MAETIEAKKLLEENINYDNPDDVLSLIKLVLNTEDDTKMKLFVIGEILTKNKNETIYSLKGEISNLGKRISNQRLYINKLKKALSVSETKIRQNSNTINNMYKKLDNDAYEKAYKSFNNNYPKKKVIIKKKPYKN